MPPEPHVVWPDSGGHIMFFVQFVLAETLTQYLEKYYTDFHQITSTMHYGTGDNCIKFWGQRQKVKVQGHRLGIKCARNSYLRAEAYSA